MGISSIFGKSFGILKANPKIILPYFIFTALIGILSIYISLHLAGAATGAGVNTMQSFFGLALTTLGRLVPLLVLIIVLAVIVTPLLVGMYINMADQGYQKKAVSLGRAFGVAKKNYFNMLLLSIFVMIIWIGVLALLGMVFVFPAIIMGGVVGRVLWLIVGVIVSIVVLVVLTLYLYEAYVVLILEKLAPTGAVSRSFQIGRQKLGLLFKILLLTILVAVVFVILDIIVVYAIQASIGLSGHKLLGLGIAQTLNFLLGSAFDSWLMMIPVIFYKEYVVKGRAAQRGKK